MSYGVVWFKRDLRLHDHAALNHALATGPVLCLYLIEPSLWAQPDASAQHYAFIKESLRELAGELKQRGGRLHVRTGEAVAVLDELFALAPFASLHAHEETGNAASYTRDRAVACWCRQHQVRWQESAQFGVVRRLRNRDQWLSHWETHVRAPCH
ncbi:MAG: deoxyribodipyrimidine photo-lyase, partial [Rhodoferax sp.]